MQARKTQATVRSHTAKSKKGKLSRVKQHVRRLTPKQVARKAIRARKKAEYKQKLIAFKSNAFSRATEAARAYIRAGSEQEKKKLHNMFHQRERVEAVKLVAKHFGYSPDNPRLARRADRIHSRMSRMHKRIFGKADRIRKRLIAKGKLAQGSGDKHVTANLKPGQIIHFRNQDVFPKWKVVANKKDGDVRMVTMQNLGMKQIQQDMPVAQLASQYDRGNFEIRNAKVKKTKSNSKKLAKKIEQGKKPVSGMYAKESSYAKAVKKHKSNAKSLEIKERKEPGAVRIAGNKDSQNAKISKLRRINDEESRAELRRMSYSKKRK